MWNELFWGLNIRGPQSVVGDGRVRFVRPAHCDEDGARVVTKRRQELRRLERRCVSRDDERVAVPCGEIRAGLEVPLLGEIRARCHLPRQSVLFVCVCVFFS